MYDGEVVRTNVILVQCECVQARQEWQGERGVSQLVVVQHQLLQTAELLHSGQGLESVVGEV